MTTSASNPAAEDATREVADRALPLVAIVGRPNVGKSTLFNRIVRRRQAIVQDEPGTTRDRNYGSTEWRGRAFDVVDTGGLLGEQLSGPYASSVADQVRTALAEADAVLFVVDVQAGVLPADEEIAAILREAAQPVYLCLNKADNDRLEQAGGEFFGLGVGEPYLISAHHGRRVGDLLDAVVEWLPAARAAESQAACRLAIVGRPNVGKSSLVNALLQNERMIVSATPGTTRDAIDTPLEFDGKRVELVDTAGMRRRGRVEPGVERASVRRATAGIGRGDVGAVVIDAAEGFTSQDQHVVQTVLEAYKGLVLVMNKMDLVEDEPGLRDSRARQLAGRARFVPWAPVVWTSALEGKNVEAVVRAALHAAEERRRRIPTARLNALLRRATLEHPPATVRGRPLKFFYATQSQVEPPTFVLFSNYPEEVHFSYERYLLRRIRQEFGFEGASLRLVLRSRSGADA